MAGRGWNEERLSLNGSEFGESKSVLEMRPHSSERTLHAPELGTTYGGEEDTRYGMCLM